jgi:maltooligosyltrehalose trehalohydrolase
MLAWYRELIALRRRMPSLTDPILDRIRVDVDEEAHCLVIHRGDAVRIALNLGAAPAHIEVGDDAELLAASDAGIELEAGRLRLPPDTLAVCQHRLP